MGFKVTSALCQAAGGKGGIIETRGPASHLGSIARHDGFTAAVSNYPDMEVLESDFGNWDVQRVRQLWDTYVNRHANIAAGYFHNDDMAFAGLESLKAVGRTAAIGGTDGMPKAIQAVLDGTLHGIDPAFDRPPEHVRRHHRPGLQARRNHLRAEERRHRRPARHAR
jgi:ribose transport system substrate-binding protein